MQRLPICKQSNRALTISLHRRARFTSFGVARSSFWSTQPSSSRNACKCPTRQGTPDRRSSLVFAPVNLWVVVHRSLQAFSSSEQVTLAAWTSVALPKSVESPNNHRSFLPMTQRLPNFADAAEKLARYESPAARPSWALTYGTAAVVALIVIVGVFRM